MVRIRVQTNLQLANLGTNLREQGTESSARGFSQRELARTDRKLGKFLRPWRIGEEETISSSFPERYLPRWTSADRSPA